MIPALETYTDERVRLEAAGTPIADFDLLIGATAIANDRILVTNNTKHFSGIDNIRIENWTNPDSDFWSVEVEGGGTS